MFLKLNSLYPDFGLHDSWPFCHALFSRKFLFIFSITCLTFYSWSFCSLNNTLFLPVIQSCLQILMGAQIIVDFLRHRLMDAVHLG